MYFEPTCRICLSQEPKTISLHVVIDSWQPATSLSKLVMACAPVEVEEEDGLPSGICRKCLRLLLQACIFQQQVVHSDRILREKLNKNVLADLKSSWAARFTDVLNAPSSFLNQTESQEFCVEKIINEAEIKDVARQKQLIYDKPPACKNVVNVVTNLGNTADSLDFEEVLDEHHIVVTSDNTETNYTVMPIEEKHIQAEKSLLPNESPALPVESSAISVNLPPVLSTCLSKQGPLPSESPPSPSKPPPPRYEPLLIVNDTQTPIPITLIQPIIYQHTNQQNQPISNNPNTVLTANNFLNDKQTSPCKVPKFNNSIVSAPMQFYLPPLIPIVEKPVSPSIPRIVNVCSLKDDEEAAPNSKADSTEPETMFRITNVTSLAKEELSRSANGVRNSKNEDSVVIIDSDDDEVVPSATKKMKLKG